MTDLGSSTDIPVYLGVWTNWSRGRITGSTLTLTHHNGALLSAFLAIYVTFVGTSFWRIASFTLHQLLSSETPEDGLYHQIQAVLRNFESGTTTFTRLLRISWAWRHKANRPLCRLIPLITASALCKAAFIAAGIFTARISSGMSDEVLISGNSCGQVYYGDPTITDDHKFVTIFYPYMSKKADSYANYVRTCYTNITKAEGCNSFIQRQLFSTIDYNATCPFREDICRHKDQNIKLDTGPISLDSDLGFNLRPDLRWTIRFINRCAPLATDSYKQIFNYSNEISYMRYFYGPNASGPDGNPNNINKPNFTYEHPILSVPQIQSQGQQLTDYSLSFATAYTDNGSLNVGESSFLPRDGLSQSLNNGDLNLVFLSANDVLYTAETNDDWYSAHRFMQNHYPGGSATSDMSRRYLSDEPVSTIGCVTHQEACVPKSSGEDCHITGGAIDMTHPNVPDHEAHSIIPWVTNSYLDIVGVISSLTTSSLLSRNNLNSGVQGPLPDNQWQMEVKYWHDIGLASLQSVVDSTIGPDDPNFQKYFWETPDPFQRKNLCTSQKIRSSSYSNFSVLGIAVVLIVGGIIIILGYALESLLDFVEHRLSKSKYSRFEWSANDILQIQRMTHEELGFGTWENCAGVSAVPVTKKEQLLAVLDLRDREHLRLKVPSGTNGGDNDIGKIKSSSTDVGSQKESGADEVAIAGDSYRTSENEPSGNEPLSNVTSGEDRGQDQLHQLRTTPVAAEDQKDD